MKLKVKDLYNLILEVAIPFCKYLNSINSLNSLNEEELKEKIKFLIYLSINILKGNTLSSNEIDKIQRFLKIDEKNKEEVIKKYFQLLTNFFKNKYNNQNKTDIFEKQKNILLNEIQSYINNNNNNNFFIEIDDNFYDFDNEEIENFDNKKISAKKFMNDNVLDIETQDEINDIINEIFYLLEKQELDATYLEHLIFILNSFIFIFNLFNEFRKLSYGILKLKEIILNIDLDNKEDIKSLKLLLNTILEDLKNWINNVIIEQSAKDIHYLDDSLLANIKQIEIILNK